MTPQSPTAVAKERHGEIGAVDLLHRIIACTHRPNPTDKSRIDIAKGAHRHFERAIEDALALVNADPLSTPSPRIVGLEARIAELEGERDERERWAAAWHSCCQSMMTILGLSSAGNSDEIIEEFRAYIVRRESALSTAEARALERAAAVLDERAGLALTRTMQRHIQADAAAIRAEARAL